MSVVSELIKEENGALCFGNYELDAKTKLDGFEFQGDKYKIKTFNEITKLERNGSFVYESVPGTKVTDFLAEERQVSFSVEGNNHTQITLDLEEEKEYRVLLDGTNLGNMTTNIGGKLVISVDLTTGQPQEVVVERL